MPAASVAVEPLVDRVLREPHRDDRALAELGGPVQRDVLDLVRRHDPVDEPDRERLVGAHLAPAPDQLLGARRADESGQPLGAARARDDAEQDLGLTDARVVAPRRAGRTRIASSRPPPSAYPLDRGDDRTRDRRDRVERARGTPRRSRGRLSLSPNSSMSAPAANAFSLPGDDDRLHRRVGGELARGVADRAEHAPATAVHRRRLSRSTTTPSSCAVVSTCSSASSGIARLRFVGPDTTYRAGTGPRLPPAETGRDRPTRSDAAFPGATCAHTGVARGYQPACRAGNAPPEPAPARFGAIS